MAVIEGDPWGEIKAEKGPLGPEPREVKMFHSRADTDSGPLALHHTLGIGHNQSSPGDHNHDGKSSRLIGTGLNLTLDVGVSTAADLTALIAMLHQVIDFDEI